MGSSSSSSSHRRIILQLQKLPKGTHFTDQESVAGTSHASGTFFQSIVLHTTVRPVALLQVVNSAHNRMLALNDFFTTARVFATLDYPIYRNLGRLPQIEATSYLHIAMNTVLDILLSHDVRDCLWYASIVHRGTRLSSTCE